MSDSIYRHLACDWWPDLLAASHWSACDVIMGRECDGTIVYQHSAGVFWPRHYDNLTL